MTLEHVAGLFGAGGRRTALVATAEAALAAVCVAALQDAGYQAVVCETGADALAEIALRPFHLAFVDADLGDDDGIVVGQVLWQEHGVPCAMLTTAGDRERARRAVAAGAMQCLLKPVAPEQLAVAVDLVAVQGREFGKLRRAVDRRSLDFEHRNIVSMAIGVSMERFAVDENEALHMIRFAARARGEMLPEFCEQLIGSQDEIGLSRTLGTVAKHSG